jgi:5-methylcytosine-specific restriction endonuclease McrA
MSVPRKYKSTWPSNVRGDVLFAWRLELDVSRAALSRLLGIGYHVVWYNESDDNRTFAVHLAEEWKINNPERHANNVEEYRPQMREVSKKHYLKNKEVVQARHKKYIKEHPEEMKAYVKKHRANNMPRIRAQDRQWRKDNPESVRVFSKKWRSENKDKVNANTRNRRARKLSANGTCSAEQATARIAFYGGMCAYCLVAPHEHLDHVIPLSRGGTNWPANLRPSCARCNLSKYDRTPRERDDWKVNSALV